MMQSPNLDSIIVEAGEDVLVHKLDVVDACW
jgi:hypothetical protein